MRGQLEERCRFRPDGDAPVEFYSAEQALAKHDGGVRLVDLVPVICGEECCAALRDGGLVYRDQHHLTAAFARSLAAELESRLPPAVAVPAVDSGRGG